MKPYVQLLSLIAPTLFLIVQQAEAAETFSPKPFKVDIPAKEVSRMRSLASLTELPGANAFQGGDWNYGIPIPYFSDLRDQWVHDYDWATQQAYLNSFEQYTVDIEDLTIHFVHEKSNRTDAIPLLMAHGWPGSFQEYLPAVQLLATPNNTNISFDVIIPSLPGFTFSSAPPINWNNNDTARVFNTLMTEVLGYQTYIAFGSDWGSDVVYSLYSQYQDTVKGAQFAFIPFLPPTAAELKAAHISLDSFGEFGLETTTEWLVNGSAYLQEQSHKPNTIGLALQDNPAGQLAWIAQLFRDWSDPAAGTGPSTLTNTTVLTSVSLYYLTKSFFSSLWIYSQQGFRPTYDVDKPAAPLGFSAFKYNIGWWPKEYVAKLGNLVFYNEHEFGGHFPGLDNPAALVADLRELAGYL